MTNVLERFEMYMQIKQCFVFPSREAQILKVYKEMAMGQRGTWMLGDKGRGGAAAGFLGFSGEGAFQAESGGMRRGQP